jgi:ABC-2 type transport system ATP-binding protein
MHSTISAVTVSKRYDGEHGVTDLTFDVPPGHILGLIGPSGSGKTTTVRLLAGLLHRDSGDLAVLGADPGSFDDDIRSRIGYLPQSTLLYPTLSLEENLEFVGSLYGFTRPERRARSRRMLELVDLHDHGDLRLEQASGGMRRRLGLAAALLHEPSVIFLDEPTAGLDPILRRTLWDRFREMREEGRTLLITTQYVGEAAYCDAITLLADGRIVASGAPEDLRSEAFGGELVDVVFTATPSWEMMQGLKDATDASDVRSTGSRSVRLTVADAGTATPLISGVATDHGMDVVEAERFTPEFDDVFVRLVDRPAPATTAG